MSLELDEIRRRIADYEARHEVASIEAAERSKLRMVESQQSMEARQAAYDALEVVSRELRDLKLRERQLLDYEATKEAAIVEAKERVATEERAFWFRRFHTSLAIAHGGALVTISSKLLDKEVERLAVKVALVPMSVFAVGLVFAGVIPYALSHDQHRLAGRLANTSGGLFVGGLITTIVGLAILASSPLPLGNVAKSNLQAPAARISRIEPSLPTVPKPNSVAPSSTNPGNK